jgi:uncharacterized repeat protein (TIGR01451 family)
LTVVTATASIEAPGVEPVARLVTSTVRAPDLSTSTKEVDHGSVMAGETITYTIRLRNSSVVTGTVSLVDQLPEAIEYIPDSVWASSGNAFYDQGAILWHGAVTPGSLIAIRYSARVNAVEPGTRVSNHAEIRVGGTDPIIRSATIELRTGPVFLCRVLK